jgi:hypothetical protein
MTTPGVKVHAAWRKPIPVLLSASSAAAAAAPVQMHVHRAHLSPWLCVSRGQREDECEGDRARGVQSPVGSKRFCGAFCGTSILAPILAPIVAHCSPSSVFEPAGGHLQPRECQGMEEGGASGGHSQRWILDPPNSSDLGGLFSSPTGSSAEKWITIVRGQPQPDGEEHEIPRIPASSMPGRSTCFSSALSLPGITAQQEPSRNDGSRQANCQQCLGPVSGHPCRRW